MNLVRIYIPVFLLVMMNVEAIAQEIPATSEQQLENLADLDQAETEDDSYLQLIDYYRKNPINLNVAGLVELREIRILTDLQIANLLSYRRLFGNLVSLYELQAIPSWDVITIRKILPFVSIDSPFSVREGMARRFRDGDHSLLLRFSSTLEKSRGYDKTLTGNRYLGSPLRSFARYRYVYKNLLQYGLAADKDAGEQFFRGAQKQGFDFYSFHLLARQGGIVKALAIGDYTVNMGQGLIQWQSLAFKKSADVMGIKRQSALLRPYNSAGEFNFNRGAGITIGKGRTEATLFASMRKLSANLVADTAANEVYFTSLQTSGYHRTASEIADRNGISQFSYGGNVRFSGERWHLGFNAVSFRFSEPMKKETVPYQQFAIQGKAWHNLGIDYSYSYKNLHFFGEAALDRNSNAAFLNGLLLSLDSRVDFSLLHRQIAKDYRAVQGNAFTENVYPENENGLYAGIAIRPVQGLRLDAYGDFFRFPWLKYLVDAPSEGTDFLVQLTWTPRKQVEVYSRYRNETKQKNQPDNTTVTNYLVNLPRQSWRTQFSSSISETFTVRSRVELLWFDREGRNKENGFLGFADLICKPVMKPWSSVLRIQYFETDGYDSRIYAYENDVLYSYSIPAFFEKGYRYYMMLNLDVSKKISLWLRFAQTLYKDKDRIGTGLDEIRGKRKSEVKFQTRLLL